MLLSSTLFSHCREQGNGGELCRLARRVKLHGGTGTSPALSSLIWGQLWQKRVREESLVSYPQESCLEGDSQIFSVEEKN